MMDAIESHTTFERLGQRMEHLMNGRVGVVCSAITADSRDLYPEELAAVGHAVLKRQREFATGRVNARRAMSRIGERAIAIPSGSDRAPIWPRHLCGSISHTDRACVAMVAKRSHTLSLGVDLEEDRPLQHDLWSTICTPDEAAHVASQTTETRGQWVTRFFSAKEAAYKWQYPLTGRMLDFHQIQVTWYPDAPLTRFIATLDGMPTLRPPVGRSLCIAGLVMSWLCAI